MPDAIMPQCPGGLKSLLPTLEIFAHGFARGDRSYTLHEGAEAANAMGGRLTCHRMAHQKGASFTLELPLRPAAASALRA